MPDIYDAGNSTSTPSLTAPTNQIVGSADGDNGTSATLDSSTGGDKGGSAFTPVSNVTSTTGNSAPKPNRRQYNPLSLFSSYTYHITLYMISPDSYNAFILGDRKNLRSLPGVYVVAQSGGTPTSNDRTISAPRAPGFELDYYIDDVRFETVLSATKPINTPMTFSIIEPYSFSFLTNLRKASDEVIASSTLKNMSAISSPLRQFFIMTIGFMGYDENGKVLTPADINTISPLNEFSSSDNLFEHVYELNISSFRFKLEGKATKYEIGAITVAPQIAHGLKLGMVENNTRIIAKYVDEAIGGQSFIQPAGTVGLLTSMNENNEKIANPTPGNNLSAVVSTSPPNIYDIDWQGDPDEIQALRRATIVNSVLDTEKRKMPPAPQVKNAALSNEAVSIKGAVVDTDKRMLVFKEATSVMLAIETIIKQSSYVTDAFKILQANKEETDPDSPNFGKGGDKPFKWYSLGAKIEVKEWDTNKQDFIYKITYIIRPYSVPAINNTYLARTSTYYGACKRYNYWLTGQNSEVMHFELKVDNSYFTTMFDGSASPSVPNYGNKRSDNSQEGGLGNYGSAQQAVITQLDDLKAFTDVKIKILGDPDFLVQDSPASLNELYNEFYAADGYTVNPVNGQAFIEMVFYEGIDYENSTGLQKLNKKISFWKYPTDVDELLKGGVSFIILKLKSIFNKGSFTQELDTTINTFDGAKKAAPSTPVTTSTGTPAQGGAGRGGQGDATAEQLNAATNGWVAAGGAESAIALGGGGAAFGNPNASAKYRRMGATQITIPSPNGPVASDDALLQTNKASGV